jgi:signal transduction histidine kinase
MAKHLSERADDRFGTPDEAIALFVHEFRNPLAVIKGYAAVLENGSVPDPEILKRSAGAIRRAVETLDSLVGSLGNAGPLFGGRIALSPEETLISTLVEETVQDLRTIAEGSELTVSIEDDAVVSVDRVKIRQVLVNLITNAIKFGPHRSNVEVVVRRSGGEVRICDVDEGPGIPDEKADQLFRKFSRLGNTKDGSGLGLYISRGIALAHGGDLRLDDGENGCRFSLTLPVHERANG